MIGSKYGEIYLKISINRNKYFWICGEKKNSLLHITIMIDLNISSIITNHGRDIVRNYINNSNTTSNIDNNNQSTTYQPSNNRIELTSYRNIGIMIIKNISNNVYIIYIINILYN